MSSINYIQDTTGTGNTFIPSTQRPDGTWRRPIRVRDGYVPQDEQPLYVSKGRQPSDNSSTYPVGLSAADFSNSPPPVKSTNNNKALYFEIGKYEPVTTIPGLNFVQEPEEKKGKKKKKNKSSVKSGDNEEKTVVVTSTNQSTTPLAGGAAAGPGPDPVKRLRNLKKKLKDIEALEQKVSSGDLKAPDKDQLEKIHRKDEVLDEIDELQGIIESLQLS